jgi:hypothetical protein
MGLFKNLLLGAVGVKTYQNIYNKPTVIPPPGYQIKGMKQVGFGSKWEIRYSKSNNLNVTSSFTVSEKTSALTMGSDKWSIHWP